MIVLKFTPLDVLMFRDGRPFNIGTDHAVSLMFPSPHTTAGALRKLIGTILNIPSDKWNELLGDWKWTPLKITGPFLYTKDHGILVEAPRIFLKPKKSEDAEIVDFLKPIKSKLLDVNKSSKKGIVEKIPWTRSLKVLEPASGLVSITDLMSFCEGSNTKLKVFPKTDFLDVETRTHIRIEGKTVSEEGGKFSIKYLRLKDSSFIVALEKGDFKRWEDIEKIFKSGKKWIARLGGENRQAVVERVNDEKVLEDFTKIRKFEKSESNLRIFITPFVADKNLNVKWAITSSPVFRRAWNKRFSSDGLSRFFKVYEPGCVFDFEDLNLLEDESFKNFRSLGYNVSLGVRPWWEK